MRTVMRGYLAAVVGVLIVGVFASPSSAGRLSTSSTSWSVFGTEENEDGLGRTGSTCPITLAGN